MLNKILISIILILMFFISFFLNSRYTVNKRISQIKYSYSNIRPFLKTGDIIMFCCTKHKSFIHEIIYYIRTELIKCEFGHVGVIYRCKDRIYLIESTDKFHPGEAYAYYLNNKKNGVRIVDLDIALKSYTNNYDGIYGIKFIEKEIPNELFIKNLTRYKNTEFENRFYIFLLIVARFFSHDLACTVTKYLPSRNTCCSDFVFAILYKCKILRYYNPKIFWPHMFKSQLFDNLQLVKYSKFIQFRL